MPLYARHFYAGCFEGPLQSFTADATVQYRKFVILGNPGSEYMCTAAGLTLCENAVRQPLLDAASRVCERGAPMSAVRRCLELQLQA